MKQLRDNKYQDLPPITLTEGRFEVVCLGDSYPARVFDTRCDALSYAEDLTSKLTKSSQLSVMIHDRWTNSSWLV